MLKVENRFMIRDLHRKGVTISDIARITGHDRKTVRAILDGPVSPPPQKRKAKAKKLDPLVPFVERCIEEGVLNCNKLLDEISRQGYQGGYGSIKTFVRPSSGKPSARKLRCALRLHRASKRRWTGRTLGSSSIGAAAAGCTRS